MVCKIGYNLNEDKTICFSNSLKMDKCLVFRFTNQVECVQCIKNYSLNITRDAIDPNIIEYKCNPIGSLSDEDV